MLPMMIFTACSSDEETPLVKDEPVNVSLLIDYSFSKSESMSRSNTDVYNNFYTEKIATKLLTPDSYSLKFVGDNGLTYDFYGKWADKSLITILEGEYKVTGTSNATGNYVQEKASFIFDEKIKIEKDMTSVSLNAIYSCFLLFFNKSDIESLTYTKVSYGSTSNEVREIKQEFGDYIYCFSRNLENGNFYGERADGSTFRVSSTTFPFENGKYYFFNDATVSFEIPKMEAGN